MSDSEILRKLATFLDSRPLSERNAEVPYYEVVMRAAASLEHVAELVEAARKHVHEERDTQYAMPTDELEAALKPFEVTP